MQQPLIIQHLFQASSLDDVSRQRLEAFVEEYPSFGIAHYLLSCKLRSEGSERYAAETQKTSLYFTNPFWLQWQLDHTGPAAVAAQPEPVTPAWEPVDTPVVAEEPIVIAEEPIAIVEEPSVIAEEPIVIAEEPAVVAEEPEATPEEPVAAVTNVVAVAEETFESGPSAADQILRSIAEARGLRDSLHKINDEIAREEPIHDEEAPFVLEETESAVEDTPEPVLAHEPELQPQAAPDQQPASPEPEPQPQAAAEPRPEHVPQAPPSNDLVFEPYHTIDYFASQGIKLTVDENPTDVLGKQLKSFTDWLKSMRRLPQKDREVVPDRVAEQVIQNFAAHSIEGKDVLTETMADVLAKQGMRERARAVYEKLSLLNPDKRAYFATKIEQLNIP